MLRFGAEKNGSLSLKQQVDQILELIAVLPLDSPIEFHYAEIRVHLEREGTLIGANDIDCGAWFSSEFNSYYSECA